MPSTPLFSLIIPCYNEEENLPLFFETCVNALHGRDFDYELIFVDDGSADHTMHILKRFLKTPLRVKVVQFSRNFGKESAVYAGLEVAEGDWICFIDADMQQDPNMAVAMLERLRKDPECDIVAACQVNRKEGKVLRWFKRRFYRLFNSFGNIDAPEDVSDFRVFTRKVAKALLAMPEYYRFSKGLFGWIGFNTVTVPYEAAERMGGKTSWSFFSLLHYAIDGMLSFTIRPLRVASFLGAIFALVALVYLVIILVEYLTMGIDVPGYPTLACLVLLLGGLQLLFLGVIGEYLGRNYIEGKGRPQYIARRKYASHRSFEARGRSLKR